MQENYLISILGRQQVDGETGEVQVTTLGSYVKKGKNRYITYKEYDSEVNGKPVTSVLKVEGNDKVTLMRGAGSTRLVLEKGNGTCAHTTPGRRYDHWYLCGKHSILPPRGRRKIEFQIYAGHQFRFGQLQ